MKKIWIPIVVLAVAGCGKSDTVVLDSNGNKVVSDNKGNVTVTGADGTKVEMKTDGNTTTYKDNKGNEVNVDVNGGLTSTGPDGAKYATGGAAKITESDLGLPFYPGSTEDVAGSHRIETDKDLSVRSLRKSADDVGKVVAFYKSKLKDVTESSANNPQGQLTTLIGKLEDGSEISILVTRDAKAKETVINAGRIRKK